MCFIILHNEFHPFAHEVGREASANVYEYSFAGSKLN